jgi:hypothetical protein
MSIFQGRSPEVHVPEGIDLVELGEIGLQLVGRTPEEAARLSQSIDWGTTLVIPVPTNVASVQEIPVRGTSGYLLRDGRDRRGGNDSVLFWQENGMLYAVTGNVGGEQLLEVAESLK